MCMQVYWTNTSSNTVTAEEIKECVLKLTANNGQIKKQQCLINTNQTQVLRESARRGDIQIYSVTEEPQGDIQQRQTQGDIQQ